MSHPARDLEFDRVLELVAAHARTGVGRFLLYQDLDDWPSPQNAIRAAALTLEVTALLEASGLLALNGIDEAEIILRRESSATVDPSELMSLLTLARRISALRRRLLTAEEEIPYLKTAAAALPKTEELVAQVAPLLGRDGVIPDDATPELARLRRQLTSRRQRIIAELEAIQRSHPAVVTDAPPTLRRERYCLPVESARRSELKGLVLDTSGSGQTTYLEPFAIVDLNNELATIASRERSEMRRILGEVIAVFAAHRDELASALDIVAEIDAAQARAAFGQRVEGRVVLPETADTLVVRGARHPLLDSRLAALRREIFGDEERRRPDQAVVPLDIEMGPELRTLIISGPNAGGKTVALKTIGLMVLMAVHGIPVPADDGTRIPFFKRLWCHIGDEQDVARDLSTFSGAMAATADLLGSDVGHSLVLYDELGAGTDPLEGAALGCALLEALNRKSGMSVVTTHLAAIAMAAQAVDGMDNAAMDYDEEKGRPTFTLRLGRPGRSRGLEIAEAMGVPAQVLERARTLLGGQHLQLERWLKRLETLEAELLAERSKLEEEQRHVRFEKAELAGEIDQLRRQHQEAATKFQRERDSLRKKAKEQLDRVVATFEKAAREHEAIGKRKQQQLRSQALDLPQDSSATEAPGENQDIAPDARVRIHGLGAEGLVHEIRGSRVQVLVGSNRLWVERDQLEVIGRGRVTSKPALRVSVDEEIPRELILLGMDAETAREEVERYLDRALASGRSTVRIVHGHGTGTLRNAVREICAHHPAVSSFEHPPRNRGGTGATEVTLAAATDNPISLVSKR